MTNRTLGDTPVLPRNKTQKQPDEGTDNKTQKQPDNRQDLCWRCHRQRPVPNRRAYDEPYFRRYHRVAA